MEYPIFERLADQIAMARQARGLKKTELAQRLGRSPARLSEFERDLTSARWGKDRLTLLAEICDALDLVPVLVPRQRLDQVHDLLGTTSAAKLPTAPPKSTFSEVFVSLSDEDEA
jgi:transcriptional regulator with XRE-family HTH domain